MRSILVQNIPCAVPFRVVSIPEPGMGALMIVGALCGLAWRRRAARFGLVRICAAVGESSQASKGKTNEVWNSDGDCVGRERHPHRKLTRERNAYNLLLQKGKGESP